MLKFAFVSMRTQDFPDRNEVRDSIDQKLLAWIIKLGFHPILIPNNKDGIFEYLEHLPSPDLIILSGGNSSSERDKVELELIHYSLINEITLFGICHGFQFLAKYYDLPLKPIKDHVATRHNIRWKDDKKYFNAPKTVNSYHTLGILTSDLNGKYDYFASSNQWVEGIVFKDKPLQIGIMWHPEREKDISDEIKFYRRLINGKI